MMRRDLPKANVAADRRSLGPRPGRRVAVDVSGEPYLDLEREARAMMARE